MFSSKSHDAHVLFCPCFFHTILYNWTCVNYVSEGVTKVYKKRMTGCLPSV